MKSFFTNLKQRYNIRDYKISLVFLVTLISLVGILMVRSARPDLMNRQIMGVCLGLIVMFIISFIDYKWILNLYWPLYALNIVMLLAVLLFGTKVNGARRWLNLGFTQFQPSDLTKILMILFFAKIKSVCGSDTKFPFLTDVFASLYCLLLQYSQTSHS